MLERIKYAKWKAADIAKAIREGRQPTPGPAGGLDPSESQVLNPSGDPGAPSLSLPSTKEDDAYVAREMAKLMGETSTPSATAPAAAAASSSRLSPNSARPSTPSNEVGDGMPTAVSPSRFEEESSAGFPGLASARARARLSVDGRQGLSSPNFSKPIRSSSSTSINSDSPNGGVVGDGNVLNIPPPPTDGTSDVWNGVKGQAEERRSIDASSSDMWLNSTDRRNSNFSSTVSPPNNHSSLSPNPNPNDSNQFTSGLPTTTTTGSNFLGFPNSSSVGPSGMISPGGRPLPTPPPRDGLPLPPGPPSGFLSQQQRSLSPGPTSSQPHRNQTLPPTSPNPSAPPQQQHTLSHPPSLPSAPAIAPIPVPSAPPAVDEASLPETLDPKDQAKAQKLCKFAASALDYDDLDTARRQLREALEILEGRTTSAATKN